MKSASVIMLLFFSGCGMFRNPAPNKCVPVATGEQYARMAQTRLDRAQWSRILFVERSGSKHCYLIFQSMAGNYYAYDARGSILLVGVRNRHHALDEKRVAKAIDPIINWATWERTLVEMGKANAKSKAKVKP